MDLSKHLFHEPYWSPFIIISLTIISFIVFLLSTNEMKDEMGKIIRESDERIKTSSLECEVQIKKMENVVNIARQNQIEFQKREELWKKSLIERSSGFPSLHKAIVEFEKLSDDHLVDSLRYKKHPAKSAAINVHEEAKRRREAEFETRKVKSLLEYYETIAPFLIDLKDDFIDLENEEIILGDYTEEERLDAVTNWIPKQDYRRLPPIERNQKALDNFWHREKSNMLLGKLYERYIGYLYEVEGYDVNYFGIEEGLHDLGRDLICKKGDSEIIVQCKNWSSFKTIYERHIFQFYGTTFIYKENNPGKNVRAVFVTTTELSEVARKFANSLGIIVKENFKFDQSYPCIKCNINNATNTKIYHLPFDQQYDRTKIINPGEFYCRTVKEAEEKGFRRAYRWQGDTK